MLSHQGQNDGVVVPAHLGLPHHKAEDDEDERDTDHDHTHNEEGQPSTGNAIDAMANIDRHVGVRSSYVEARSVERGTWINGQVGPI